jgi:hypothetical protein
MDIARRKILRRLAFAGAAPGCEPRAWTLDSRKTVLIFSVSSMVAGRTLKAGFSILKLPIENSYPLMIHS